MLVMVSGGSGVTPFISIIREAIFLSKTTDSKIPRILLVAVFKRSTDLTMLDLLLPVSGSTFEISHLKLQIQAYITRDKDNSTDIQKQPRMIWFKPRILDRPVSAVLGENSWLWLGAIISSSFLIFLILIGILAHITRQNDQNVNNYSFPVRSGISVLFLSLSVLIAASVAFISSKRHSSTGATQIQSAETPTPVASPVSDSCPYEVDRELESPPLQTLPHITAVNYGERPDFESKYL